MGKGLGIGALVLIGIVGVVLYFNRNKLMLPSSSLPTRTESGTPIFYIPQDTKPEAPQRLTREQLLSGNFNFDAFRTDAR